MSDRATPTATHSFERRAVNRMPIAADPLAVGAIRVQSLEQTVAPAVVWRRSIDDSTSGPLDPGGQPPGDSGMGDLLQRARALFSAPPPSDYSQAVTVAPDPYHPRPGDPPTIRRLDVGQPATSVLGGVHVHTPSHPVDQAPTPVDEATIEWIIEAVEARVLDELERRGLRYNPGVF
jgi:hypothetical protein